MRSFSLSHTALRIVLLLKEVVDAVMAVCLLYGYAAVLLSQRAAYEIFDRQLQGLH